MNKEENINHKEVLLKNDFQITSSKERTYMFESVSKIDEIWDDMPLAYKQTLINQTQGNPFSLNHILYRAYRIATRKLSKYLQKKARAHMMIGWRAFIYHRDQLIKNENIKATTIQSTFRRYSSQYKYQYMKQEIKRKKYMQLDQSKTEFPPPPYWIRNGYQEILQSIVIQKFYRGYIIRKQYESIKLRFYSANIIQFKWKSYQLSKKKIAHQLTLLEKHRSSIRIQSWFRRICAKVLRQYLLHLRNKTIRAEEWNDRDVFSRRFIRIGAAQTIFQWYQASRKKQKTVFKKKSYSPKDVQVIKKRTVLSASALKISWDDIVKIMTSSRLDNNNQRIVSNDKKAKSAFSIQFFKNDEKAAIIIQTSWRYVISRNQIWLLCVKHFEKIIDGEETYWHNKKTRKSMWKKPVFFGHRDIMNPTHMPQKEYSLERSCDFCGKATAKWYDAQDREVFCDACNLKIHSKGRSRNNIVFPIKICSQCYFQMASKHCTACDDVFCDSCFFVEHKTAMLKLHPYLPILRHCDVCQKYVARIQLQMQEQYFCSPCSQINYTYPNNPFLSSQFNQRFEAIELAPAGAIQFWENMKRKT